MFKLKIPNPADLTNVVAGTVTRTAQLGLNVAQLVLNLHQTFHSEIASLRKNINHKVDVELVDKFKKTGVWQIHETTGSSEITLTRTFHAEKITLVFSLSDTEQLGPNIPTIDDTGSASQEQTTEHVDLDDIGTAVTCTMTIVKPLKGALLVKCIAVNNHFLIDNVSYTDDASVATRKDAEADYRRSNIYIAPQFDTLGEPMQQGLVAFLEERGFNDVLAKFILEYSKQRERVQRINWLEGLEKFITKDQGSGLIAT
ncbi:hypothetical protein LshimejAT787_0601180 [Lyophyllum shimeji]|uniref:Uncharacterized protein n=1 Tax=Lyophyllum shimeji TaxID=47721 RepID=A0A9P3PPC8_LYOSH|nr:hypothetical protein LshimejAT787_0601180 [Lyophyllum shimeji]